VLHHFDDYRDAATFFAEQPGRRAFELDLRGSVGAVA
jgi:hypothetical protein